MEKTITLGRPRLRSHYRAVTVDGEGAVLLSDGEPVVLAEPVYARLLPLLDGRPAEDAVAAAATEPLTASEVEAALQRLSDRGFLLDETGTATELPPTEAAWWASQGASPRAAEERLVTTPVAVTALGRTNAAAFAAALGAAHVRVDDAAERHVVLTDSYLHP
ncbi:MAG: hypothetical protein R3362_10820, partial [Rhodothermales bacterium]|nr:hypothetical protein [Rhodothermales bacterium]